MKRTVLVTGGTGGLGAAVTSAFLAAGNRVVVPWVAERELERLAPHPALDLVEADLFDPAGAERCVTAATASAGAPLGAVVNLVGGYAAAGKLHETPVEDFERMLMLNLRATYLVCQAALPHLVASAGGGGGASGSGGGAIVCVSARAAVRPFAGAAGYITAKAAVLGLVGALAAEYGDVGVRTNAILPGVIDTPANRAAQPGADRSGWVAPERIADTIVFLCGPGASAINGAQVPVHG